MTTQAALAEPAGRSGTVPPVLTVVVPCFNERPNVAPLAARLAAALEGIAWEVVFVDDDSPDGTAAEARRLAERDGRYAAFAASGGAGCRRPLSRARFPPPPP